MKEVGSSVTDLFFETGGRWKVSLVKQGTLTRPEHLVPPPRHYTLMFERSTCCEIYTSIYRCVYVHTIYISCICVFICIWMYVCECMFIHVHLILYFIWLCLVYGLWHLNSGWWFDRTGIYLKPLHRFAANFVWNMFFGLTPTTVSLLKSGCYPYSSWNYG